MNHLWNFDKVGSGGVYSTVEDLARWESNFIQPRVGDRDFLRQIVRPGVLTTGDTLDYAFGLRLGRYRGKRTVGHGGSLMAFRTRFVRFPELGVAVIVLCNTPANTRHLAERIADAVIGDRLGLARPVAGGPAFIDFDSASIAARTGAYRAYDEPGRGRVMRLSVEADRLIVRTGRSRLPFRPIGDAEFVLVDRDFDGSLRFVGAETVAIDFGGEPFTLRRFQPVAPDLEEYTGEYYSEELRALYVATVSDAGLVLDGPRDVRFQLRPSIRDEFTAGPVVVRFRRDDGRVVAFDLDRRRVRGLRFHRR